MWGQEMERSPALAAPGSKNYGGNRLSGPIGGIPEEKNQALSDAQFELVANYLPLAYSMTGPYHGKGLSHEELRAGAEDGLLGAALNFKPDRGFPFAAYARPCIRGGITALFIKKKFDKLTTPVESIPETEPGPVPPPSLDLSSLDDRERLVVEGRAESKTLKEVGKELGRSAERARQIEAPAEEKVRQTKGNVARACIHDLIGRRGHQKPTRQLLPDRVVTYPGRSFTPEEIAAFVASRPDLEGSR